MSEKHFIKLADGVAAKATVGKPKEHCLYDTEQPGLALRVSDAHQTSAERKHEKAANTAAVPVCQLIFNQADLLTTKPVPGAGVAAVDFVASPASLSPSFGRSTFG